ncbi:hypothetical protein K469DRAFT_704469 [Zopfia rhizophila CBS 207.26]|uniref:Uncharacterized protein n=1 Tax=Zopfia rhizophila CBS 207.26 TaxID=1314779 RepID=A0A6A6E952_9PEZI|nr:hypothetical protein K469DRAFT_704469 [Zopfia rhizophila CBS 207.26]
MATSFESSDVLYAYTTISRSSSSTGASRQASPAETSPAETSSIEGLQGVPIYQYTGVRDLQERVKSQSTELQAGRSNQQYLVFRSVTKGHLDMLDRKRASIGKHTRMTHYTDTNLLIVKLMPSVEHEITYLLLADDLSHVLAGMGLPRRSLIPLGGSRFSGPNSSKEGDSAYKPRSRNRRADWPTLVFESRLSETLTRLRHDARWWLTNSGGDVRIVIIILITPVEKRLQVEKWCLSPATGHRPATRAHLNSNPLVPTRIQEVTITQNPATPPNPAAQPGTTVQPSTTTQPDAAASYAVTGAPLILEFQNLLLRAPIPPEGDVVFPAADLLLWADSFWESVV